MMRGHSRRLALVVIGAAAIAVAVPHAGVRAAGGVTLNETGSTLLYPLFRQWSAQYRRDDATVHLTTAGTGSTAGVAAAIAGTAQIGTSDAYMSDEEIQANPTIVNVPLAISAQTVNYNVPGLNATKLRLSGNVLAGIYAGSIATWDDKAIATLNPGVRLPHHGIVPIHRSDGSGDTFMFTQFLTFSTKTWEDGPYYGTTIVWPNVAGSISAVGNPGMIAAAKTHPYSIAYVGYSLASDVDRAGLGTAILQNQDGNFIFPSADTIRAGASMLDSRTPRDERLTLVYAPGPDSYPIVSYEYAVVSTKQPSHATAAALRKFLLWAIDERGGNAPESLEPLHFVPLPEFVRALSIDQIDKIQ